ncbi:hypothetical protein FXO37_14022 [Capsicum annuum]|nr:hypothetical protein FXO37_14022 [Capsicum annuum]
MNRSHQSVEDKDLSVFDGEENDYGKDDVEEVESPMHDDSYTEDQYTEGPIEGMSFRCVQTTFTFYKEHSHLTGFRVFKKSAKKLAGQLKYVTFGYDKFQKIMARNQSKRVDCKTRVNYQVMNGGSCIVTKVILEHNHELEPALSHFLPFHRELSRMVKRSLVAHDIAGLRPSKSIRLLEVKAGGPERMRCTPKDYRNYILQQQRLRTLSSDTAVLLIFLWICNPSHSRGASKYHPQELYLAHLYEATRGYPTMMDEYRVYNGIKKWLDRNCNLILDYPVRCRDLKSILKAHFKIHMAWKDDMAIPNVPDSNSNTDSIIIRNPKEVRSRGCNTPYVSKLGSEPFFLCMKPSIL